MLLQANVQVVRGLVVSLLLLLDEVAEVRVNACWKLWLFWCGEIVLGRALSCDVLNRSHRSVVKVISESLVSHKKI